MYIILGAGGFAGEVACNYFDLGVTPENISFFDNVSGLDSREVFYHGKSYEIEVKSALTSVDRHLKFTVGVGDPQIKYKLVSMARAGGLSPNNTMVHPSAVVQGVRELGMGGIIAANVSITTSVRIGNFVILNLGVTIGHDVAIGEFVTVNPLAAISGKCVVEDLVLIGVGASVREGITIRNGAVIGGQSFVCKEVLPGQTVVGVPARPIEKDR